jgi:uncharacterized protein
MPDILREILSRYSLPVRGYHGILHWARVLENGVRLAPLNGAKLDVIKLFAVFHDSCRTNDSRDDDHGVRAAEFVRSLRGTLVQLCDSDFDLLFEACRLHTEGRTEGDITLQTCWDADRLDLGRVGIVPQVSRLCTDAARALLGWAHKRAIGGHEPTFVAREWAIDSKWTSKC